MGNILYLECCSGISGDMTAAALLDLGADSVILDKALQSLPLQGFQTKITRVKKAGLDACDFHVILQQDNHDHDMEYLHGSHSDPSTHIYLSDDNQDSCSAHKHSHCDGRFHHGHSANHDHRPLSEILSIIQRADMTDRAKQTACNIFHILGRAEAEAHGVSIEDVHFHEVGAVDSIVDIISAAVCLDNLNITDVIIPVLYEGCGTIRCQHGILPVPVPAVVNIVKQHKLPLHITGSQGEFVTPTGAAIAAAVCTGSRLPDQFHILRTGLGVGKRTYDRPSLLRAMLIEPAYNNNLPGSVQDTDYIYKLETNIDDCTGEIMGYVLGQLMDAGAKDVHYMPVYMKKNRPAYQLNVLCSEKDIPKLEQIIFCQTTTIGIRRQRMQRSVLPRELRTIQTVYGEVHIKVCRINDETKIYPEYDSVIKLCAKENCSYLEMYCKIEEICRKQLLES